MINRFKTACFDAFKISGDLIRSNETYDVIDNKYLKKLTLSQTTLHPNKRTTGHSHDSDEIYIFLQGYGTLTIGEENHEVSPEMIVQINSGLFHQVVNDSSKNDLVFLSIFNPYR